MTSKGLGYVHVHIVSSMYIIVLLRGGSKSKKFSEIESKGYFDKFTSTCHTMHDCHKLPLSLPCMQDTCSDIKVKVNMAVL